MSAPVPSDHEDLAEQLLAVPEEEEAWSEEETSRLLLLATEAPGTPEKDKAGALHEIEHGVTAPMAPPAETAPLMLENAGQPLKRGRGRPREVFLAFTLREDQL